MVGHLKGLDQPSQAETSARLPDPLQRKIPWIPREMKLTEGEIKMIEE
jgi:hypothetical protein